MWGSVEAGSAMRSTSAAGWEQQGRQVHANGWLVGGSCLRLRRVLFVLACRLRKRYDRSDHQEGGFSTLSQCLTKEQRPWDALRQVLRNRILARVGQVPARHSGQDGQITGLLAVLFTDGTASESCSGGIVPHQVAFKTVTSPWCWRSHSALTRLQRGQVAGGAAIS